MLKNNTNKILKVFVRSKNSKFDPKKTAKKFAYGSVIVFVLQILLNFLQSSQEPFLDLTVKSLSVGVVLAGINYYKHK